MIYSFSVIGTGALSVERRLNKPWSTNLTDLSWSVIAVTIVTFLVSPLNSMELSDTFELSTIKVSTKRRGFSIQISIKFLCMFFRQL